MDVAIPNVREGLLSFDFVKNFAQFYEISGLEMTTNFAHFSFKSKLSNSSFRGSKSRKIRH